MSGTSTANDSHGMDVPVLDRVFAMEGGFVLRFFEPNPSLNSFREELRVDIDDPRWAAQGGSKAKRLRYYLRQVNRQNGSRVR